MRKLLALSLFFSTVWAFSQIKFPADLIIHNANIYTVDDTFSKGEAMAILNGKIREVGSSQLILAKYQSKEIQDLKGKTIVPGLIDAHCHFTGFAADKWKLELWGTKSWEEIIEKLIVYSKNAPMEWLYGRSWDQNDWPVQEFPEKSQLDKLFPNRPVYLKRVDGHAAIANQKALDIAGITTETTVAGGDILQENGKLTGVLIDNAMLLVEKHLPEISEELQLKYTEDLQAECFSFGLTSVHDCGISNKTVQHIEKMQKQGKLNMNIFALIENLPENYDYWLSKGRYTNGKLTVGGFKIYSDGTLGSRGACLIHDYSDKPGWKGFLLDEQKNFDHLAERISKTNLQMCTHAIGDSANSVILDIYGKHLPAGNDKRWRIEHAQIVDPADFQKFAQHNIIPSVQPTHATSDMYWAESRLGKARLENAYAYRKLLQQNGWLPLGTDFPVEAINPMNTFFAAVARKDAKNFPENGFQKENALNRQETLRGMTIWAAKAAFQENERGSLESGKVADFIVLNQDLMTVSEDQILKTTVFQTWIDGKKRYSAAAN